MEVLLKSYILQIADNAMIHGQRLGEWCGHGPAIEPDIALTNIALDEIGLAKNLYSMLAEREGGGKTEDTYPSTRDAREWRNVQLLEQPNGHFGHTIMKQFLYDSFQCELLSDLQSCKDEGLAAIAAKSLKESLYHFKFSKNWLVRLGDGTEESHQKMTDALQDLWMYSEELFMPSDADTWASDSLGVDLQSVKERTMDRVTKGISEATLAVPEPEWMQSGGKDGLHTEYLGFILTELQYMQRAYPGLEW